MRKKIEFFRIPEFLEFLDRPRQEDDEIEICQQLSEHRDSFKFVPSVAKYFVRWNDLNLKSIQKKLYSTTSDEFADTYLDLWFAARKIGGGVSSSDKQSFFN